MQVAEVFGNRMVLQRETIIPVWGTAVPGERVRIEIQGQTCETVTDPKGEWRTDLEPLETSFEETMIVAGKTEKLVFSQVAVGEVWIAAGQSNMEFHMRYDKDFEEEKTSVLNPQIRFFDYPLVPTEEARKRFDYSENFGFWRPCDADNLQWF